MTSATRQVHTSATVVPARSRSTGSTPVTRGARVDSLRGPPQRPVMRLASNCGRIAAMLLKSLSTAAPQRAPAPATGAKPHVARRLLFHKP